MFSVLILTLNEERNLPACLASVAIADDIVVLDSGSTDRTADIARAAGARVFTHAFHDFAAQRNYAHEAISFCHAWVLHLDADEQMTPGLAAECARVAEADPADVDGFYVAPRMTFHGRWIPHCTDFPAYQARFVHARRFRFMQVGHGQREAQGMRLGTLRENYVHNLSSHSDAELEEKHRRYAVAEARAFWSAEPATDSMFKRLRAPAPLVRRRALKELSQKLPARSFVRFAYQYLWRRGFLDGRPGLAYCLLLARYESWIAQEIRRQRRSRA